jgi:phosphoribosylanthranilate isomerase
MAYRLRIKVCGITTAAAGQEAVRQGADAIGLNFYHQSPRYVDRERAQAILQSLPPWVDAVGVFVDTPWQHMVELARSLGRISSLQRHGEHHDLSTSGTLGWIPAFAVRDRVDLDAIAAYLKRCRDADLMPTAILVDGHSEGQYGGTGQRAPWHLLAELDLPVPLLLAGGLTPDNVAEAIRIVRPYGVDVASGVEDRPGTQNSDKMQRFIDNARAAVAR